MTHTPGFSAFWAEWPANRQGGYMRKGGRAECHKRWVKHHHESQAETILAHVRWMKTTGEWLKDNGMFIPMPITYINQQKWDGADIPEAGPAAETTAQYIARMAAERAAERQTPEQRAKAIEARDRALRGVRRSTSAS